MADKPVKDYDKFMLRFPDGMRDAVAERAKANGRSMNSEIIGILEDAFNSSVTNKDDLNMNEMKEIISIQAELLEKYSEFVKKGSKTLEQISESLSQNKKPE